jgi:hypothetical protein
METKTFFHRYRLSLDRHGTPIELQRTPRGTTYLGHEMESGREVAIELIPATAADPAAIARLEKTAAAAKALRQLNLPVLHDFGIEDDQFIYITEAIDGHTAEAWVAARGPLRLGAVLRVGLQVTAALEAITFHKLPQPEINPANLLFISAPTAEADWPAIKVLHWLGPHPTLPPGVDARADAVARYLSPEQRRGGQVDFASSIFSLGCTLWFLLSGAPPAAPGPNGTVSLRGVPKIARGLLERMLRLNPAERPQDPVALQADLQTCLNRVERRTIGSRGRAVAGSASSGGAAVLPRPRRKLAQRALAGALLLLLVATVAVVALPRILRSHRLVSPEVSEPGAPPSTPVALARNAPRDNMESELAPPAEGPPQTTVTTPKPHAGAIVSLATPAPEASEPIVEVSSPEIAPAAVVAENRRPTEAVATPAPTAAALEAMATSARTKTQASPEPSQGANEPAEVEEAAQPLVAAAPPSPTPSVTPTETKVAAGLPVRKGSKTHEIARSKNSSSSRPQHRTAHAEVRRALEIPQLRVGGHPAELVGTTSDGRWILSVDSSGQQIVVPPPPGFKR